MGMTDFQFVEYLKGLQRDLDRVEAEVKEKTGKSETLDRLRGDIAKGLEKK